ncbi:MAG: hypothetical protein E7224_04185 [Clostridiales bacterium]|nr:hypothetical protein [Clostridiales bacterium]
MYLRKNYTDKIIHAIEDPSCKVINLFGEKGIGKSALGKYVRDAFADREEYLCGYFDFNQYKGLAQESMVNALYDLCDFLTAHKTVSLYHFNITDHIHSSRQKRVPYADRKIYSYMDKVDEVTGFASEFIELPYVGAGLKVARAVTKMVRKYRPKTDKDKSLYEELSKKTDRELENFLPKSLAMDVNESLPKQKKQLFVAVENFDDLSSIEEEWFHNLIEEARDITWLILSRNPLNLPRLHVEKIALGKMSREEMEDFLVKEKNISDPQEISWYIDICGGIPLHIDRAKEYLEQQKKLPGEIDWDALRAKKYEHIAAEALRGMSADQKEMLFQLNLARYFDEDLFERLFPGKLFALHKKWFESSLFTEILPGERYCVQNSMKEEIRNYMDNCQATEACFRNLFRAEMEWFRNAAKTEGSLSPEAVGQHSQSLYLYGKGLPSSKAYFEALQEIGQVLVNGGQMHSYYRELLSLAKETQGGLRLAVLRESAMLAVHLSDYKNARELIRDGLALAEELSSGESKLTFTSIQMALEHIAPAGEKNAPDQCVQIAKDYMEALEKNIKSFPYKTFILNMAKAKLYLAKEYVIKEDFPQAEAELAYIFHLCKDPRKLSALSLYSCCGKAQEQQGEIYAAQKNKDKALAMYLESLETYQVAEVLQPYWDSEFYLNFGLVHKRAAEGYFSLAGKDPEKEEDAIRKAICHLDQALDNYREVKKRVPEIIDTYCKMGFAFTTAAENLWEDDRWNEDLERYLALAEEVLNEALEQIKRNGGEGTTGNRQIANSRCILSRTSGLYYQRRGMDKEAEKHFLNALDDGDAAVNAAPGHPYGYMEAADNCLKFALFLQKKGRLDEAKIAVRKGLAILDASERACADQPATSKKIKKELEDMFA